MKIVHTEASCGWGGQELRILSEASGHIARGHEVTLLCPPEATIFTAAKDFGVPAVALPIGRKRPAGLVALRRWLAHHRVDVINTHSSTDAWLGALVRPWLPYRPAIVRTRHISAALPKNFGTRWLYTQGADHVVTTGERLRDTMMRDIGLPGTRVTSIPTGIDGERFHPGDKAAARDALGLSAGRRYAGIVATLRSWKGHLFLLEAWARFGDPGWHLLIVGDGPMREAIAAKIAELGLHERVTLAGQRADPENWLRALDVFCLPSYANEGVPQAVLQSMFTALPIVTTPVGSILDAVTDKETALIVPPKDAPALAAALARLAGDSALCARLGEAARQAATSRFSRGAMLDRMEHVFRGAMLGR